MIEHVYRRVSGARAVEVIVATDDLRIATRVHDFGGKVRLTKATHATGTDRLAEVVASMDCDVVVNVQGDEPLIDPRAIDELIAPFAADPTVQMTTLFRRIQDPSELNNPNITKVVVDRGGFALYFSRAPIPFVRDPGAAGRLSIDISVSTRIAAAPCSSWRRSTRPRWNGPNRWSSCARWSTASASKPWKRCTNRSASTRRRTWNRCVGC